VEVSRAPQSLADFCIDHVRVFTPDPLPGRYAVCVRGGKIIGLYGSKGKGAPVLQSGKRSAYVQQDFHDGEFLVPGFIDLHVHGGDGGDFSLPDPNAHRKILRFHARHGTTSLLATTVSLATQTLEAALIALRESMSTPLQDGARILGVHLEGPFLSPSYAGAQDLRVLRPPNLALWERWDMSSGGAIRLVTLAPELPGALSFLSVLREKGVLPAAGHTAASFRIFQRAVRAGLAHVTHLFNGMPSMHHRRPGPVGATLLCPRLTAELIADGVHLHVAAIRLAHRLKGARRLALVTDAISAAGLPDGHFRLGETGVEVRRGRAYVAGTHKLAGSTGTMELGLRRLVLWAKLPLADALRMASTTPSEILGLTTKGRIALGYDADLVLLDRSLRVVAVWREGQLLYSRAQQP